MMFGWEIKDPGDWQLELAEESPNAGIMIRSWPEQTGTLQEKSKILQGNRIMLR